MSASLPPKRTRSRSKRSLVLGSKPSEVSLDGIGDVFGGAVVESTGGPNDAVLARRPDPKKCLSTRHAESPSGNEIRHRRTYDLNKKLAEDLGSGVTIITGRPTIGI